MAESCPGQRWRPRIILVLQQMVELGDIGDDGELVRDVTVHHVLRIKQAWDAETIFSNLVRQCVILQDVLCPQGGKVDEVWPEVMDNGTEGKPVPPGSGHVSDGDAWVVGGDPLAPDLESSNSSSLHRHLGF